MYKRVTAVTALVLGLAAATPVAASAATASKLTSRLSANTVTVATKVSAVGTLRPAGGRLVAVQQYYSKAWHTVASGKTNSGSAFAIRLPSKARGNYSYRVVAARTSRYGGVTGPTLKLAVSGISKVALSPLVSPVPKGAAAKLTGTVSGTPPLARPIRLQRRSGTSWTTAGTTMSSSAGRFSFALETSKPGAATYRVSVPATTLATAVTSSATTLIVNPTGPFVLVPDDDYRSVTAHSVTGGSKLAYRAPLSLSGALDVNATGQIVSGEIGADGVEEQLWTGGTLARKRVYRFADGECLAWTKIAPGGQSVLVADGWDAGHGYCFGEHVKLVNTRSGSVIATLIDDLPDYGQPIATFSPDGRKVAVSVAKTDVGVTVFDTATGQPLPDVPEGAVSDVHELWWTQRGLVIGGNAGSGYGLATVTSEGVVPIMDALNGQARSIAVTPDGNTLIWESSDQSSPVIYRTPMHYDNDSALQTTRLSSGTPGEDADGLVSIGNAYVEVDGADWTTRVLNLAGRQLWSGSDVLGWMN